MAPKDKGEPLLEPHPVQPAELPMTDGAPPQAGAGARRRLVTSYSEPDRDNGPRSPPGPSRLAQGTVADPQPSVDMSCPSQHSMYPPVPTHQPAADKDVLTVNNPAFSLPHIATSNNGMHGEEPPFIGTNATPPAADSEEDSEDLEHRTLLVRSRKPPVEHRWNKIPLLLLFWFLGGAVFYYYVRVTEVTGPYGWFIMSVELLGLTSFLPYALLITRGVYPTGSPGLPAADSEEAKQMTPPPGMRLPRSYHAGGTTLFGRSSVVGDAASTACSTPTQQLRHRASVAPGTAKASAAGTSSTINVIPTSVEPENPTVSITMTPATQRYSAFTSVPGGFVEECYRFHVRVLVPCYKEPLEVVRSTLRAAQEAILPAFTRRTIYLCDDGSDDTKKKLVEEMGPDVVYVSGRKRKPGEINGKSANLNNCFKNVIYKDWPRNDLNEIDWSEISNKELLVVFDADMCAKPEFFLRMLEPLLDDNLALVLSPQSFHNINGRNDLFNNINKQFWECWLPGAFGWGYIACTGTNFCIRARALADCGWFPDYTITEDYALGMELKSRGYKATYLMLYLAEGEAPEEIRNVFRQRSRWNKGHFQVFFSWRTCPLLYPGLPFFQRLWYSYAAWAPICTIFTVPVFMVVPFMSIVFGFNPVTMTFNFVLAASLYFVPLAAIQSYAYNRDDSHLMWFAAASNTVLWFVYVKALINVLMAKMGMKTVAFKVTEKVKPQADGAAPPAPTAAAVTQRQSMVQRMLSIVSRRPANSVPGSTGQPLLDGSAGTRAVSPSGGSVATTTTFSSAGPSSPSKRGLTQRRSATTNGPEGSVVPITPRKDALTTRSQFHEQHRRASASIPAAPPPTAAGSTSGSQFGAAPLGSSQYVRGASPLPSTEAGAASGWVRFKAVMASFKPANIREFDEMLDPVVLLLLFLFSTGTFAFGVWQTLNSIDARAPAAFDFNSPLKGSPYLIISTIWAFFNCIVPYLFLHYCVTAGPTFRTTARVLMWISNLVIFCSLILTWLLIPAPFDVGKPLNLQLTQYLPSQVATDVNSPVTFVQGVDATPISLVLAPGYLSAINVALATADSPAHRRSLAEQHMSEVAPPFAFDDGALWDPVSITEEELQGPGELEAWQRSLLAAANSAAAGAVTLPDGLNLAGGLLVKDHVKYGQPMSYAITQLSWAVLQYPRGFTDAQMDAAQRVIRSGAEYLIRCLLKLPTKPGTPDKYAFVAQVGDARDYAVVEDMTVDPSLLSKIWTSPAQDPFLSGKLPRKVWILDENHVGADLLANAAAALAATSEVFTTTAPGFSKLALAAAKKIWQLAATGQPGPRPRSYCDFVPCTTNVTVNKPLITVPASAVGTKLDTDPVCYYVDWSSHTCQMLQTAYDCSQMSKQIREVYKTKIACCSMLASTGVWDKLATRGQGICAVPDKQFNCYIPDASKGSCYEDQIDPYTGRGCAGEGLNVYASPLACCNFLVTNGVINAAAGRPGSGVCARSNLDPNFNQCYVPSITNATCIIKTGAGCSSYGIETVFDDPTACCFQLYQQMNALTVLRFKPLGICALPDNATLPGQTSAVVVPVVVNATTRRSLLKRELAESSVNESDWYWDASSVTKPASQLVCADNACDVRQVPTNTTIAFYNSTTTLDDMAWGGVWLYRASKDARYLGEAQRFLERHYTEDISKQTLNSDRSYYVSDWNNLAWATNMLLLKETGLQAYDTRMRTLLNAWVFGTNVKPATGLPAASTGVQLSKVNALSNFTDPSTNETIYIVPSCTATQTYEVDCFDGIDNDCDGFIDREDVDCGLFPVVYTTTDLAYSQAPSLPHAAAASWLGMVYADERASAARKLRCWALGQVAYMMGATPNTRSYIVGVKDAPCIVQHRASSCPVPTPEQPTCTWDNAYWPTVRNPQPDLVGGALLAGPDRYDGFREERSNDQTQVTLDGTVPLTGVLAGLLQTGTSLRSCELMHGLYQRLTEDQEL